MSPEPQRYLSEGHPAARYRDGSSEKGGGKGREDGEGGGGGGKMGGGRGGREDGKGGGGEEGGGGGGGEGREEGREGRWEEGRGYLDKQTSIIHVLGALQVVLIHTYVHISKYVLLILACTNALFMYSLYMYCSLPCQYMQCTHCITA